MPLTDNQIKQAKPGEKEYRIYDMDGLYLAIKPNGTKTWRYKFRLDRKEYTYTIGRYPDISLKSAREELRNARDLVAQGINPTHDKARRIAQNVAAAEHTFKVISEEWIAAKAGSSDAYINGIKRDFENYVYPTIGNLPVDSITPAEIKFCLDKCAKRGIIVTGMNIRSRMSSVFMYAIRTMRAQNNPALPFENYFNRPAINHAEALSTLEIKQFKQQLEDYNGSIVVKAVVKFIFLTGSRTIEARRAEWADFDFDNAVWRVSAKKMKKNRQHIVPLSKQVCALLCELKTVSGNGRLLFPNMKRSEDMISATTVNRALEYMGVRFTGHDFRATMATHLSELGFEYEHIKAQLSHAKDNQTDAAYFHARFINQRRIMMQAWADFVDSL